MPTTARETDRITDELDRKGIAWRKDGLNNIFIRKTTNGTQRWERY